MVKTQPGLVMGSVRYMSPEQARGKETDERTDVWSLGVVLYEMLSGSNPFEGETISDSLAALIHIEPKTLENIPERMDWIISKALRKDANERYENIRDFALDLKELRIEMERDSVAHKTSGFTTTTTLPKQDTSENKTLIHQTISAERTTAEQTTSINATQVNTTSKSISAKFLPIALVTVVATAALGAWYYLPSLLPSQSAGFESIKVSRLTNDGNGYNASVSPDGKLVAYVNIENGQSKLIVSRVATSSQVEVVPATEQKFLQPTFSPDGEFIYYVLQAKGFGVLYKVSILGGASKKIADDVDSRVAVSPDGKKLAFRRHDAREGGDTILVLENGDVKPKKLIQTKAIKYDRFLNVVWTNDPNKLMVSGFKRATESAKQISVIKIDLKDGSHKEPEDLKGINEGSWNSFLGFVWLKDDSGIVFIGKKNADDTEQIWNLSFVSGEIKAVTTDTSDYYSLSVSDDQKTLVATKAERISSLLSYEPKSKETKQILRESRTFIGRLGVSQTADGKILYSKRMGKEINIFLLDEDGSKEKQLTFSKGINLFPTVTADGEYIVFTSSRGESLDIWRMDSDGGNPIQLTSLRNSRDVQPRIINEGKTVIFTRQKTDDGRAALMSISIDGGEAKLLFPDSKLTESAAEISRDGKTLAFVTFEYDKKSANIENLLRFASLNGEEIEITDKKISFEIGKRYTLSPDGKAINYIDGEGNGNVWILPLDGKEKTPLTDLNSGVLTNFTWSNDRKKLFLVKGLINSDLVLIRDQSE